jgi:hypothetical protein
MISRVLGDLAEARDGTCDCPTPLLRLAVRLVLNRFPPFLDFAPDPTYISRRNLLR